jgi:hypothetical protein
VLSGPEEKTSKDQVVISVARWRPSTLEVDQVRDCGQQARGRQARRRRARLCPFRRLH